MPIFCCTAVWEEREKTIFDSKVGPRMISPSVHRTPVGCQGPDVYVSYSMANKEHHYNIALSWTGNQGTGTSNYKAYERSYTVSAHGKPNLLGSSDPAFRGDPGKYNPEELLLAALSGCHMLMYLHLCSAAGVVVIGYEDVATGKLIQTADGGGQFSEVTLHPNVVVAERAMIKKADSLHEQANKLCFIANSCNFPVGHSPVTASLDQV